MTVRVMLVDDHAIVRGAIAKMLEVGTSWNVMAQLHSGADLLRRLEVEQPDVVVLDMNMPGKSGPELIEELRQVHPAVAVVVLSMTDSEPLVRRALLAGAQAYVLKASDFHVLVTAIQAVMRGQTFVDPALVVSLLQGSRTEVPGKHEPAQALSRREIQVLDLFVKGMTPTEIADRLFVSVKTVSTHKTNIMKKLRLTSTMQMLQYAIRHDLVEPNSR